MSEPTLCTLGGHSNIDIMSAFLQDILCDADTPPEVGQGMERKKYLPIA